MTEFVVDVIDRLGALGVGFLIFLENVIPPIPSEVVLPFAGFTAERGELNAVAAWFAATVGALAGAWLLYGIGAAVGEERVRHLSRQRWFVFFGEKDLDRGLRLFDRHGGAVVLVCRFIPLVRSVVSVPAGMDRMPLVRFSLLTFLGSGAWNAVFIYAGWQLGERWERVEDWVGPASYAVVAALVVGVAYLTVRNVRRRRAGDAGDLPV